MSDRDMIYGGFYQNIPGNFAYNNFAFQTMPNNFIPYNNQNMIDNNPLNDINNKINNLEQRIKVLEQKLSNTSNNPYEDDNSMYMI